MAYSNIVLQGATYPTVPGIRLPNTNNSTTYLKKVENIATI